MSDQRSSHQSGTITLRPSKHHTLKILHNISNNKIFEALKSPVPAAQGGGPVSTRPRCAGPLVFSLGPLTGSPSLLSQFPAIVLGAASRPRLLPGIWEKVGC